MRSAVLAMALAVAVISLSAHERGSWFPIGRGPAVPVVIIPQSGIPINVGNSATQYMQAIVNANTPGVSPGCIPNCTFLIKTGTHRLQTISPRNGDVFLSETNAIMSGARLLSATTGSGTCPAPNGRACWWYDGQTQQGVIADEINAGFGCSGSGALEGGTWFPICFWPEDVYFDNLFKYHCKAYSSCPAGGWYLDYNGGGAFGGSPADRLYVFDNPSGHVVEASVTPIAFNEAFNVTIKGLIFEKYATPYASSAITLENGMTLDGVEGRYNHYSAVSTGSGGTTKNSHLHHNMCTADRGGGNAQFLNNEIDHNNYFQAYDEFWGCGGTKWNVAQGGAKVLNNNSHDNVGPGFWCDTSCDGVLYDGNTISSNTRAGIFYEISYSATITNNTFYRNGWGKNGVFYTPNPPFQTAYPTESGIAFSSSGGATSNISFNTLTDNYGSIQGVQDNRCHYDDQPGQSPGRFWYLQNMNVHDNTIVSTVDMNGGTPPSNGIIDSEDSMQHGGFCPNPWTSLNNKWTHNTYTFGTFTDRFFVWQFGFNQRYTSAEWRAIPQDATGIFH